MTRYNLERLPLCGAKTRSGEPCKRRGCKENGRCKLHGGKSTGSKTRAGKAASSKNALKIMPDWLLGVACPTKEPLFLEALICIENIKAHVANAPFSITSLNQLVGQHKDALEVMKYVILEKKGVNDFLFLQSALDHYYRNVNAEHVKLHVYHPLFTVPHFGMMRTEAQEKYLKQWEVSSIRAFMKEVDNIKPKNMKNIHIQLERGI